MTKAHLKAKLSAVTLVALGSIGLGSPAAKAGVIEYTFSPNASMTVNGAVETLFGDFFWDTTTDNILSASITVNGGPYTNELFNSGPISVGDVFVVFSATHELQVAFVNDLGLGMNDPIALGAGGFFTRSSGNSPDTPASSVSGLAVVSTPEPASLALFGIGLAGLGMVLRTRRV